MTASAHATAGLDLLRANPDLTVYDTKVAKGTSPPYVLVYTFRRLPTGLVAPDKIRLSGGSRAVEMELYCHCVGENATAARVVQDEVAASLLDVIPTIAGRVCFPIRYVDGAPTDREEQAGPLYVDQVDIYGWSSVPSS